MKLACNIDRRGRVARVIAGLVAAAAGAVLIAAGWRAGGVALAAGAFMIFEGVKGWCAARALGIKTPL
jgi:hypothetical protein